MSRAAKGMLALSLVGLVGIVGYVHHDKKEQTRRMKLGVVRDRERMEYRTGLRGAGAPSQSLLLEQNGSECVICDLKPSRELKAAANLDADE